MKKIAVFALLFGLIVGMLPTMAAAYEFEEEFDMEYYGRFQGQGISINVFNWGEYISDGSDDSLHVNQAFEALTGIKVNYLTFANNEEMYSKLRGSGVSYDVIIPSDYMISRMITENMLLPLNFDNIPAYQNIDPQFVDTDYDPDNRYSVPYTWGTVGIIYNTTMVDPDDDMETWDILWDERYAGQILMFGNSRDAFGIALKKLGYSMNPSDAQELEAALQLLLEQKPLVQAYVMDEIFDKMAGGEAAMAPYYAGDFITMLEDNPDLAFAVPREGTNIFIDAMCIPAGSQQQEAAEIYINFMCEAEVAAANIDFIGYSSPNAAAFELLDDEVREDQIRYPSNEVLDNTEFFLELPADLATLMDNLWISLLTGSGTGSASTNPGGDLNTPGGNTAPSSGNDWLMPAILVVLVLTVVVVIVMRGRAKKRDQ